MLHFRGITCRIKRERTQFSISSHRQRIVTTKCIPQSTQTTHCHNAPKPQPLQNQAIRACSRCWTKRILVVHSVIKVTKCLSSYVWRWSLAAWRWSLAANASCSMWHWSLAANASCSFFFRFSFSSSCSFRFRRLACISHASAGKVSVSESVIVSDGKLGISAASALGSPASTCASSFCVGLTSIDLVTIDLVIISWLYTATCFLGRPSVLGRRPSSRRPTRPPPFLPMARQSQVTNK